MGGLIAKYQITNGGPIILVQPENEYGGVTNLYMPSPQGDYMQYVMDLLTKAGVVVPFISNDSANKGHNRPGTGTGEVDVYGYDSYPLGFDCSDPTKWSAGLEWNLWPTHLQFSPNTPHSILEFQGGTFDRWGGTGYAKCAAYINEEFARVFIKNNYAQVTPLVDSCISTGRADVNRA